MGLPEKIDPIYIEKLVQRSKNGDNQSFEKLFDIFFEKISRYISFKVDENEREDLVSDVFLKIVEKINTYKEQRTAGFNAWVFRIAHNTVIDFYRRKKELLGFDNDEENNYFLQIEDEDLTPDKNTDQIFNLKKLKDLLEKLPIKQREIIELKYLEEFSNIEIAKITGFTEGNIRVIQLRALRDLRGFWENKEN